MIQSCSSLTPCSSSSSSPSSGSDVGKLGSMSCGMAMCLDFLRSSMHDAYASSSGRSSSSVPHTKSVLSGSSGVWARTVAGRLDLRALRAE